MKDDNTGFKAIPVPKLREILNGLPDDTLVSCQTLANTGNLGIYRGVWPNEEYYGHIDFRTETLELMEEAPP